MTMTATLDERVEAGMDFLDERRPGWMPRIDLDRLNISSSLDCVLGQLGGNYYEVLDAFGLNSVDSYGFGFSGHRLSEGYECECYSLTLAWRQAITARMAASS